MSRNLDGSDLVFEQDAHIRFIEDGHRYLCDDGKELTPVSHVVAQYFEPFDSDYWAPRKAAQMGIGVASLLERWENKKLDAAGTGTFMHKQIEMLLNGEKNPETVFHFEYNGKFIRAEHDNDISTELGYFHDFVEENTIQPFRTEWVIYDRALGISGTADLVCRNGEDFEIFDWKRSSKVVDCNGKALTKGFGNKCGINGLETVGDTSFGHYCIQQNLYRYILETNYGVRICRMTLVVLHPGFSRYFKVEVPRMDAEIAVIVENLRK